MTNENNKRSNSVFEKPKRKRFIPPEFSLSATSGVSKITVNVSGVVGVSEYSSEDIVLKTRKGGIRVKGNALELTVFEGKSVLVSGEVDAVEFISKRKANDK